jgi:hypothetical protein
MKNNKNIKSSNKNPIQKFVRSFINFCRKFNPTSQTTEKGTLKQLSFDSLRLVGNKRKKIEEINKDAGNMIKNYMGNVNGLLEFIERRNTKVIRHRYADKIINIAGELEGFIPPVGGLKGKFIMLGLKIIGAWDQPIGDITPPLFVFSDKEPPMGYMVHQIHHWLSYNKGLPGYSEETMENFKRIFDPSFGVEDVKKMSKEEIIELREAIARDREALAFVEKMAQEIFKPQDILKGIKDGDNRNL